MDVTECIVVCYMLGDVMLQLLQTFVAVLICGANNLTCLVIYSEHQPSEILVSQICLIAQCREVLAQVIEVEIVLGAGMAGTVPTDVLVNSCTFHPSLH